MGKVWIVKEAENSAGALRLPAISEERFKGFLAGVLMQQALPFLGVQLGGMELVASCT